MRVEAVVDFGFEIDVGIGDRVDDLAGEDDRAAALVAVGLGDALAGASVSCPAVAGAAVTEAATAMATPATSATKPCRPGFDRMPTLDKVRSGSKQFSTKLTFLSLAYLWLTAFAVPESP